MARIINIIIGLVLIMIASFPAILEKEYSEDFIELYINDYQDISLNATSFDFSFSIKNLKDDPVTVTYYFYKEAGSIDYLDAAEVSLRPEEIKTFEYNIRVSNASRFVVFIPETEQSVHMLVMGSS